MKTSSFSPLAIAAILALGIAPITSAHATDAGGTATVELRAAITLSEDTGMDFGAITPDPAGDTVTIATDGSVTSTGASDLGGTPAAGGFTATGTPNAAVTISFSTGDVLSGAGTDIPLGSFAHDAGVSPAFDGSGDLAFDVGANLTIGASQTPGTYNGTYTATVEYQ